MNIKIIGAIIGLQIFCLAAIVNADTIYFNNGGTIEGIIKNDNAGTVEIDVGFGTITCSKSEIKRIERSSAAEAEALTDKWERKGEELKKSEAEFSHQRQKRFEDYDRWTRETAERQAKESDNLGAVDVVRDPDTHNILVEAMLNDATRATLVLDTGASIVVLTRRKGEELGIDLSDTGNVATMQLAGNHKATAKMVILKSVRIKDIEVKDVLAGVLLEDADVGFKDGLLGMSFLSKFNLKIDLKNMKISLEKAG